MASPILSFIFLLIWNLCFSHEIVVSIIVQAKFCTNPVVHACKRIVVCFIRRRKDFHVRNKDRNIFSDYSLLSAVISMV